MGVLIFQLDIAETTKESETSLAGGLELNFRALVYV